MSRYLLDTNICIYHSKGRFDIANRIEQVGLDSCYLSEITLAEMLYGAENSEPGRRKTNLENVEELRASFEDRILLIGDCFYEYARQKAALRRAGRIVGEFDLLIGCTAIVHDLILVTRNIRDFENISGLRLENWIVG